MCSQRRKIGSMPVKKLGRPYVYKDRERVEISLPKKAVEKADELRGKQQLAPFITEIVCEKLGLNEDDIYVK